LVRLAGELSSLGEVGYNEYMLRFRTGPYEIVLFPDGRALVNGTTDEGVARSL
jgi:adenylyltransferase/sulfurtransferase